MSNWEHTSDADFLANLTFNDETKTAFYTRGDVVDGEPYLFCKVFKNNWFNSLDFEAINQELADNFMDGIEDATNSWLGMKTSKKSKFVWDLKKSLAFDIKTPNAVIYNNITNVAKKVRPVVKGAGWSMNGIAVVATVNNITNKNAIGLGDVTNLVIIGVSVCYPFIGVVYFGADICWHIRTGGNGIDNSLNSIYEYKY